MRSHGEVGRLTVAVALSCFKPMNLILEESAYIDHYTYLAPLFDAAPSLENYWYLLTEIETNLRGDPRLYAEASLLAGSDLRAITAQEPIQFIWGVFSAFTNKSAALPDVRPYADGNESLWMPNATPQAAEAAFEIVCWDSSATLFIGIDDAIAEQLQARFPDIRKLD